MPSPFPGMDPYIERPQAWPDFHDRLITFMVSALQPLLKPRYVAVGQERVYVAESKRLVRPDVAVVRSRTGGRQGGTAVAELKADAAKVFAVVVDDVREPFIQIVDPTDLSRVVTAIEVISPKNKRPGAGRKSYLQKRQELWRAGANLLEIDLLRAGKSVARLDAVDLEELRPFDYLVVVSRQEPAQQEVYATTVRDRLPRVAVPLRKGDADVTLDLQGAFTRCWNEGPYPEILRYDQPPPGPMSETDVKWCVRQLVEKKLR